MSKAVGIAALAGALSLSLAVAVSAQQAGGMSFFVTSVGPGKGADLGGLEGADRHCQTLAQAAGAGGRTWRAYLSTQGQGAVNARDRIGRGPNRETAEADPRMEKIRRALEVLHDESAGRAERIQEIFSLEYDPNWTRPQPR